MLFARNMELYKTQGGLLNYLIVECGWNRENYILVSPTFTKEQAVQVANKKRGIKPLVDVLPLDYTYQSMKKLNRIHVDVVREFALMQGYVSDGIAMDTKTVEFFKHVSGKYKGICIEGYIKYRTFDDAIAKFPEELHPAFTEFVHN